MADEWCAWWQAFDDLLLLKRGGHATYVGPLGTHSVNLINYFEVREGLLQWSTGFLGVFCGVCCGKCLFCKRC